MPVRRWCVPRVRLGRRASSVTTVKQVAIALLRRRKVSGVSSACLASRAGCTYVYAAHSLAKLHATGSATRRWQHSPGVRSRYWYFWIHRG